MPITTTPAEADPALRPGRTEGKARDCAGERFRSLLAALLLARGVATLPACDGGGWGSAAPRLQVHAPDYKSTSPTTRVAPNY